MSEVLSAPVTKQPKTTSAERMKALRQRRLKEDPDFKLKESQRISEIQKRQRQEMSPEELNEHKRKTREKVARWRLKKKETPLKITDVTKTGFKTPQSKGKAVRRLLKALPNSPSKRVSAVSGLAKKVGVDLLEKMNCNLQNTGTNKNSLSDEIIKRVTEFYFNPSMIYTLPGIKDEMIIKENGIKSRVRKYYLTCYLKELFALFKLENPTLTIGFSKFASLRPKNVLLLKNQPLDQCKCKLHENFRLKLEVLTVMDINFWSKILCDCEDLNSDCWRGVCEKCSGGKNLDLGGIKGEVSWKEWIKDPFGRMVKSTMKGTGDELRDIILKDISNFQNHVRVKRVMSKSFEVDKASSDSKVIQVDFAMAYSCEYQDEIQSALWSRQSVNLFTAAVFDQTDCKSFLIVTDSHDKGKDSVFTFINELSTHIVFSNQEESLIIYSDGPSSEFKNKFITGKTLALLSLKLNRPVFWKYFATSHGKGVVDGIGGAAKARVRDRVRSKGDLSVIVQSAQDFANVVKQALPNVYTLFISHEKITENIKCFDPWNQVIDAPGIKNAHIAKAINGIVELWHTDLDVNCVPLVTLDYKFLTSPQTPTTTSILDNSCLNVGQWVVVMYDGKHYPGEVTQIIGKNTEVNVMVPTGNNKWMWPTHPDKIFYLPENIIKIINLPDAPCATSGRLIFSFEGL